jgi:hypothetical protein
MPGQESRGSLLGLRERYLWLWRQLQKIDATLRISSPQAEPIPRQELWAQRLKRQLKRYWP